MIDQKLSLPALTSELRRIARDLFDSPSRDDLIELTAGQNRWMGVQRYNNYWMANWRHGGLSYPVGLFAERGRAANWVDVIETAFWRWRDMRKWWKYKEPPPEALNAPEFSSIQERFKRQEIPDAFVKTLQDIEKAFYLAEILDPGQELIVLTVPPEDHRTSAPRKRQKSIHDIEETISKLKESFDEVLKGLNGVRYSVDLSFENIKRLCQHIYANTERIIRPSEPMNLADVKEQIQRFLLREELRHSRPIEGKEQIEVKDDNPY